MPLELIISESHKFRHIVIAHAQKMGLQHTTKYRLIDQQDLKDSFGQVLPRVWTGKNHTGENVTEVHNGGVPWKGDLKRLRDAINKEKEKGWDTVKTDDDPLPPTPIFDFEPQWAAIKTDTPRRQVIDAFDCLRMAGHGFALPRWEWYASMWDGLCDSFFGDLPHYFPDAYWWRDWSRTDYREAMHHLVSFYNYNRIPSREVTPFHRFRKEGGDALLTIYECKHVRDLWSENNIVNGLLWCGARTMAEAMAECQTITAERVGVWSC